jgi:hypothetical protein
MSQENVEIVRAYFSAWNAGGLDAAREFWSDDLEWQDAPEMPDAASYKGAEAAAAHFRDLNEVLGSMKVEVDRLLPVGDEVFVSLRVHLDAPRGGLPTSSSMSTRPSKPPGCRGRRCRRASKSEEASPFSQTPERCVGRVTTPRGSQPARSTSADG